MTEVITYSAETPDDELVAKLRKCSVYAQSPQRTMSTDELLDELLARRE